MHAASKCLKLGLSGLLLAAMVALWSWDIALKGVLAIFFQFLTTPVSAHMISRAAYHHLNVGFWKNTLVNEWDRRVTSRPTSSR